MTLRRGSLFALALASAVAGCAAGFALAGALAEATRPATDGAGWRREAFASPTRGVFPFVDRAATRVARLRADPARLPDEARIAFIADQDADGRALSGASRYVLTLGPRDAALLGASWSVAVHDPAGNPPDRMAGPPFVSASNRDAPRSDGSVTITIQGEPPDDPVATWLGAPPGPFRLVLRVWEPDAVLREGAWRPPSVQRRDRTA